MGELLSQLGINWKLLLSQGLNFAILFVALVFLVYKPLARIMEERRQKIEFGLRGADEAEKIVKEAEETKKIRISEAEKQALSVLRTAEEEAGTRSREIIAKAERKSEEELLEAKKAAERKRIEIMEQTEAEAKMFVRATIMKTVELEPDKIDEKLIEEAVRIVKNQKMNSHEI